MCIAGSLFFYYFYLLIFFLLAYPNIWKRATANCNRNCKTLSQTCAVKKKNVSLPYITLLHANFVGEKLVNTPSSMLKAAQLDFLYKGNRGHVEDREQCQGPGLLECSTAAPCTTSTTQLQLSNGFSCTCFHFEAATPSLCHSLLAVATRLKACS